MIPVIAVQVAPHEAPPALEERMLEACSAGLRGARCVRARSEEGAPTPQAIAVVSWLDSSRVSIEVGLRQEQPPVWRTRNLAFEPADPEIERWRAVGFTIALLVGDERWAPEPPVTEHDHAGETLPVSTQPLGLALEARAVTGAGLVSSAWRVGGELRLSFMFSRLLFVTSSVQYALASDDAELDVRWFDASVGVGLWNAELFENVEGRVRVEFLLENLAVTAQRAGVSDQQNVWIPGVLAGADLGFRFAPHWVASARVDAFGLDGSTAVTSADERVATSAGAGVFLGAGAGYRF